MIQTCLLSVYVIVSAEREIVFLHLFAVAEMINGGNYNVFCLFVFDP